MFKKKYFIKTFLVWLPFIFAISCMCLLVYGAVQHVLRIGANDPQIQMAEDAADALSAGKEAASILPNQRIDISKSLAPHMIIYDNQGHIFSSSATLHGSPPQIPGGVFADAERLGELRFTWQPEEGIRQAVVVVAYPGINSGFVLAGRSLREVEYRIDDLGLEVVIAWIGSLLGTFVVLWIVIFFLGKDKKKRKK